MYDLIFFLLLVTIGAFNQKFYIYINEDCTYFKRQEEVI